MTDIKQLAEKIEEKLSQEARFDYGKDEDAFYPWLESLLSEAMEEVNVEFMVLRESRNKEAYAKGRAEGYSRAAEVARNWNGIYDPIRIAAAIEKLKDEK